MADSCISTNLPKAADGSLELDCALTSGGRIVNDAGTLQVQHFIRDHLGSVRTIVDGSTVDVIPAGSKLDEKKCFCWGNYIPVARKRRS